MVDDGSMMDGKVALVVGGTTSAGAATALAFAAQAATVIIVDSDEPIGRAVADKIHIGGGETEFIQADVTDASQINAAVLRGVGLYGRIDYAVNAVGIPGPATPLLSYPDDAWAAVLATNLTGTWLSMKAELNTLLDQPGGGVIVNIAPVGEMGWAERSAYVAAYHGVVGLTRSAALEYIEQGVRINAVTPLAPTAKGPIDEPEFEGILSGFANIPPQPDQYLERAAADAVIGLCLPSSTVTGAVVRVERPLTPPGAGDETTNEGGATS